MYGYLCMCVYIDCEVNSEYMVIDFMRVVRYTRICITDLIFFS